MERPLVVGVDGSDGSLPAIDRAVDEAARHGRPLRLVHGSLWERYEGLTPSIGPDRRTEVRDCVLDAVRAWRRPAHTSAEVSDRGHEERARAELGELLHDASAADPGVRVTRTAIEGPARKVLVHRSAAADLVVVGARRRQGHFGLQLGTVAHTLPHHAECPVAVVPQSDAAETLP
ncbi:universal stress protein [Streptomyces sp. NPDC007929]|uniref:universal stress protein n=1 Tax=unclassified Streptomyces TaxID=2593676 RepID=UPI0036E2A732